MEKQIRLPFVKNLEREIQHHPDLIHVVLGPRQVGKTTGVLQWLEGQARAEAHYASADGLLAQSAAWLQEQWTLAEAKNPNGKLVIDEVQKIENWSELLKKQWDRQRREKKRLKVVLLGSSSLGLQKGLSESLTGRFLVHRIHHWNFSESAAGYRLNFEQFLRFGGYPGSYRFTADIPQWLNYMRESIVDTVIGKDILQLARVQSPALFRQSFELAVSYGAQEISYNKLLGQLQSRGNVELVKHYLELFEGAFLLKQLFKFSPKPVVKRSSSPKILPLCPALYSLSQDADFDEVSRGRAFEIAVGCELARLPGSLHYWREGGFEVDYVYQFGKRVFAIEVKSGGKRGRSGLERFTDLHRSAKPVLVTPESFQSIHRLLEMEDPASAP